MVASPRRRASGRVTPSCPCSAPIGGLLHPVGPDSVRTYWARRALVFGAAMMLAIAVALIISGTSGGSAARPNPPANGGGIEGPYVLRIPRIGVDAHVVPIKSNEEGILEPPRDPSVAGWWSDGAPPGEAQGSSVLVGHSVPNKDGGVFDDLGDLSRGDAIEVEGSHSTLTYRVQSNDVLSKDDVARNAAQIFDQTGAGRLVVITCGDFEGTVWRSNIVITAAPVS